MNNRMLGYTGDVVYSVLKLCQSRKDWNSDKEDGSYYRKRLLMYLARKGEITDSNIGSYIYGDKLSKLGNSSYMYHLLEDDVCELRKRAMKENYRVSQESKVEDARVSEQQLARIYDDILFWRIQQYLNEDMYMNQKILCILGESGVGKTMAANYLASCGVNVICSFTTRAPRAGETEGVEHHFIDIIPDPSELLAYTNFGGNAYYALKSQVHGECTVYVIDEEGLRNLKAEHDNEYQIFTVYIKRDRKLRRESGVTKQRVARDRTRKPFSLDEYDYVVENNSDTKSLFSNIAAIYNEVAKK